MFKRLVTSEFAKAGIRIGGSKPRDIRVTNDRFYSRVALYHSLGLGEAWMDGDFECDDLSKFLNRLMRCHAKKRRAWIEHNGPVANLPRSLPEAWVKLQFLFSNQQTVARARRVGKRHYDLGDDFYRLLLGPSMTYSCGYWKDAQTLEKAQENKYRIICEKIGLKPGMRVLEIGCGWGGFARFAAEKYHVEVICITISTRQAEYVSEEILEFPKGGHITPILTDYRDIPRIFPGEKFDAIVSIGMFEHVGPANYAEYMRIAFGALKEGRPFLLHTIVGNGGIDPFLWYHIFPGGILPKEEQIAAAAKPYFAVEDVENFGFYYSLTLAAWRKNLAANKTWIVEHYDESFYRMFEFYLTGCEIAFELRSIHLEQWVLVKGGTRGVYQWNRPSY